MDKITLVELILQSFPESALIIKIGLTLAGRKDSSTGKILVAALISAGASYFVRLIPLQYGFYTVIGVLVMAVIIKLLFRYSLSVSFIAALSGMICLCLVELFFLPVLMILTGVTLREAWKNEMLRILMSLPELLFLAVLSFFLHKNDISIERLSKAKGV